MQQKYLNKLDNEALIVPTFVWNMNVSMIHSVILVQIYETFYDKLVNV